MKGDLVDAKQVVDCMLNMHNEQQAQHLMRFFKTGKGDYGEGDKFLGLRVPATRKIAARGKTLPLQEVEQLLASPWHEVRLCGLLVLVAKFEKLLSGTSVASPESIASRDRIVEFYLGHARCANNWDLVDLSVYKILGEWLLLPSNCDSKKKLATIDRLAASDNLWEQRMSVVCTMAPLKHGDSSFTLRYAEWHLHHPYDLMHKAVGWMLREMGKRVSMHQLREFLHKHASHMPRTTLRYAIEHMADEERKQWMQR